MTIGAGSRCPVPVPYHRSGLICTPQISKFLLPDVRQFHVRSILSIIIRDTGRHTNLGTIFTSSITSLVLLWQLTMSNFEIFETYQRLLKNEEVRFEIQPFCILLTCRPALNSPGGHTCLDRND